MMARAGVQRKQAGCMGGGKWLLGTVSIHCRRVYRMWIKNLNRFAVVAALCVCGPQVCSKRQAVNAQQTKLPVAISRGVRLELRAELERFRKCWPRSTMDQWSTGWASRNDEVQLMGPRASPWGGEVFFLEDARIEYQRRLVQAGINPTAPSA